MAILGTLLKKGLDLSKNFKSETIDPFILQKKQLIKLLNKAEFTEFGQYYNFSDIIFNKNITSQSSLYQAFKSEIPIYTYNSIFKEWWHKNLNGEEDITWPGKVKYFALSSGTSEASTKHIPLTKAMLKAIKKTSVKQMLSLAEFDLPKDIFEKRILMLGGSTHLQFNGTYYEGDLSGISTSKIPFWFQHFYKPGKKIAKNRDWESKLNEIVENASKWDVGYIVGVPAWIQIMMERIIEHYKVKTIHDIWPNLYVFCHGGVAFEPYKKSFEKLLAKPLVYIETYLASEGFIAFQTSPNTKSMKLVLNGGIFYEFVPFNDDNFDAEGEIKPTAETLMINEVKPDVDYAILLSTCAGAWRYLIGDVVRFTDVDKHELIIRGRTKHFLSLCGEHLSVDNMNKAIKMTSEQLNVDIKEFTVAGVPFENMFAHHWYLGSDDKIDTQLFKNQLDEKLKLINDDYKVERICALKDVIVEVLPSHIFMDWMKSKGKVGGSHKFPRVMKNGMLADWTNFISTVNV